MKHTCGGVREGIFSSAPTQWIEQKRVGSNDTSRAPLDPPLDGKCKDISSVWTLILKWAMCASISVSVIVSVEDASMLPNHLTVISY